MKHPRSETESLAYEMVSLERRINLAAKDRRYNDAYWLEQTREEIQKARSALLREQWLKAETWRGKLLV